MATLSIPLHSRKYPGLFVNQDEEDYERVSHYRWNPFVKPCTTYAIGWVPPKGNMRMHRLIMGDPPGMDVDHCNGNGLDNRRANLRVATRTQNMQNQRKHRRGTNTYKGVHFHKAKQRWRAEIALNGKGIWIGAFRTEEEAARAYDAKAVELFGEFARIDFPFQGILL